MTAPLAPFRCAVTAAGQLVMRSDRWRMVVPVSEYGMWLKFYRRMRDRQNGRFARFYAQPVQALEAIESKVKEVTK